MRPNGFLDSFSHFIVCSVVSVGDNRILRKHLRFVACIFFSKSAVKAYGPPAYENMEMTRKNVSQTLESDVIIPNRP